MPHSRKDHSFFAVVPGAPRMDALRVSKSGIDPRSRKFICDGQHGAVPALPALEASRTSGARPAATSPSRINHRQSAMGDTQDGAAGRGCGWVVRRRGGAR